MIISTEGDLGDVVYLLCIISQLNDGPHTLLFQGSGATKFKGADGGQRLYDMLHQFVLSQPYIKECRVADGGKDHVDWKSAEFRSEGYVRGQTLMDAHLVHLIRTKNMGQGINAEHPWLFNVTPDPRTKGKAVLNRTGRYRNSTFPWADVVSYYRSDAVFVGLKHEWREFISHFGYVQFLPTSNMLELAQAISGSEVFIGNQSCSYACAEGMKKTTIQEVSLLYPDCIYKRSNAQYCYDGACILPTLTGMNKGPLKLDPMKTDLSMYSTKLSPPGQWQYPGIKPQTGFRNACNRIQETDEGKNLSREEVERRVLMFNVDRCPGWQKTGHESLAVLLALDQAGITQDGLPKS